MKDLASQNDTYGLRRLTGNSYPAAAPPHLSLEAKGRASRHLQLKSPFRVGNGDLPGSSRWKNAVAGAGQAIGPEHYAREAHQTRASGRPG